MTVTTSPLRYPGGKSRLFPFVADLITRNSLFSTCYREPYAGGAGLALNLLFSGFCKRVSLNDLDPCIYSFWLSIINNNDEFCSMVSSAILNIDEWHKQKEIWKSPESASTLSLGFATYYLNRTNRSGIIDGAGPIGGYDQRGNYKLDARFNRNSQISIIREIGKAKEFIDVTNLNALDYLKEHLIGPDFIYLDPPYYIRGRKLYRNYYDHDDHVAIADVMKSSEANWLVSYDDVEQIRRLYSWVDPIELRLLYSAGTCAVGKEVLYVSPNLTSSGECSIAA